MKKILIWSVCAILAVGAIIGVLAATGVFGGGKKDPIVVSLDVPDLTIDTTTQTASWTAVENAKATEGYTLAIDTLEIPMTATTYSLATLSIGNHSIKVKANGYTTSTHNYTASEYCAAQTYAIVDEGGVKTTVALDVPTNLAISGTMASWTAVTSADVTNGYIIRIDGNEEYVSTPSYSLATLAVGTHQISVKTKGYLTSTHIYTESAYCTAQTYTVPVPSSGTVLGTPVLSLDTTTYAPIVYFRWTKIANRSDYEYRINDGAATAIIGYNEYGAYAVKAAWDILTVSASVQVRAVGNEETYFTGEWSNAVAYTAPAPVMTLTDFLARMQDPTCAYTVDYTERTSGSSIFSGQFIVDNNLYYTCEHWGSSGDKEYFSYYNSTDNTTYKYETHYNSAKDYIEWCTAGSSISSAMVSGRVPHPLYYHVVGNVFSQYNSFVLTDAMFNLTARNTVYMYIAQEVQPAIGSDSKLYAMMIDLLSDTIIVNIQTKNNAGTTTYDIELRITFGAPEDLGQMLYNKPSENPYIRLMAFPAYGEELLQRLDFDNSTCTDEEDNKYFVYSFTLIDQKILSFANRENDAVYFTLYSDSALTTPPDSGQIINGDANEGNGIVLYELTAGTYYVKIVNKHATETTAQIAIS